MRTSACVYGCPEYRLALSACADLYHAYGLPMWGTAATEKAREILNSHSPVPLSDATRHTLDEIHQAAKAQLKDHRFVA